MDDDAVVLGIDLGTTATKVVAYTASGTAVASASEGYPLLEPHSGWAVQDPQQILAAAETATAAVVAQVGVGRVAGLSFSSEMHSLLALDAAGQPLTQVATWADTRAARLAEKLRDSAQGLAVHRRTGTPVHPMSPLTKLAWYRSHPVEGVARWCGIKDYLLAQWCGRLVIDHSCASGSGLMNLESLDWDAEALQIAGVSREQLPELVPTTAVLDGLLTETAVALGLPVSTPVVVGAGDGPLANLGVGAVRPGVAACSIGTSGALRVAVERPAVDPNGQVFCYNLAPGRWVVGGAINNGGVVLQWGGDALAPDLGAEAQEELLALAGSVPAGSGGLLMTPYLLSERAPHWSALSRGAYVGLERGHRREHLLRAALEGVCQQMGLVLASMCAAELDVTSIRATGGFARSPLWRQMLADTLDSEISFADGHEGSSFGAAVLGMAALGLVDSIDVAADLVAITSTITPGPDADTYRTLRPIFDGLYEALLPSYRALSHLDLPL